MITKFWNDTHTVVKESITDSSVKRKKEWIRKIFQSLNALKWL